MWLIGNNSLWDCIVFFVVGQVVDYEDLVYFEFVGFFNKFVVFKFNGGFGIFMGCVGFKLVIEVCDGMFFFDMFVCQVEYFNCSYGFNVFIFFMNFFNIYDDIVVIIKKYEGYNVDIFIFNQLRYFRIFKDFFFLVFKFFDFVFYDWYFFGYGDVFEFFYNFGVFDQFIDCGIEIIFFFNVDNFGVVVDFCIFQYMVESEVEYIMELINKIKVDVKGGIIIDYEGSVCFFEIVQVFKEYVNEFKFIKKFKYFNINNIWMNVKVIKCVVENNEFEMEIIFNGKIIFGDKKGELDISIFQLEIVVGVVIKYFKNVYGVNVFCCCFLFVKICFDLMFVKFDFYIVKYGQFQMSIVCFGDVFLIKFGGDFKKVFDFQKCIFSIFKIIEFDYFIIIGVVNFGCGVVFKGIVIIVVIEGQIIDIFLGFIFENVVVQGSLCLFEY